MQQICDRGETAVQDDVAGFGQRLLLEFDDVLERAESRSSPREQAPGCGFRKYEEGAPVDVALENLMHGDEPVQLAFAQYLHRARAPDQRHARHRQNYLLSDHLAQA